MFICGLLAPLAVKIVPCAGVLNDSVPEVSANTSYVLVPPIISAVACSLPAAVRLAIEPLVLSVATAVIP